MSKMIGALTALVACLGLVGAAQAQQSPSHDPSGVLRVGKIYTFGGGADLQHGFGMDLRYQLYPDAQEAGYLGVFATGQYELGDAWRFAGGLSAGWGIVGVELGVSHRTATTAYAGATGLHLGQSFTLGPVSVGGRLTIPLTDDLQQGGATLVQGIEGAVMVRLAWGFTLHGERSQQGCSAHRGRGVATPHGAHH